MSETFLRTFSVGKPLSPAVKLRESTNTTATAFKLIDSTASFTSMILLPGMIAVNVTDKKWARILAITSATELLLDKNIFGATSKTYQLIWPARDVIVPGTGQELILFRIWAKKAIATDQDTYKAVVFKQVLSDYNTQHMAETDANGVLEIEKRLLPTDTEFYVCENWDLNSADYIVEGLDKTLTQLFQSNSVTT